MTNDARILKILQNAALSVAELGSQTDEVLCSPETVLVGEDACLDSMGFINFVVAVEDSIARDFGIVINLTEELEKDKEDGQSTLTVGGLTSFLSELLREKRTNA